MFGRSMTHGLKALLTIDLSGGMIQTSSDSTALLLNLGKESLNKGDYVQAIRTYNRLITILKLQNPIDEKNLITSTYWLGYSLVRKGEFSRAKIILTDLQKTSIPEGTDSFFRHDGTYLLAEAYLGLKETLQALTVLKELETSLVTEGHSRSPLYFQTVLFISRLEMDDKKNKEAKNRMEQVLPQVEATLDSTDVLIGSYYDRLSTAYSRLELYDQALKYSEKLLTYSKLTGNKNKVLTHNAYTGLIRTSYLLNDFEKLIQYGNQKLQFRRLTDGRESKGYSDDLYILANMLRMGGLLIEAEHYLEQSLVICGKNTVDPDACLSQLMLKAILLGDLGDQEGAIRVNSKLLETELNRVERRSDVRITVLQNNLAAKYLKAGDYSNAQKYLEASLELGKKVYTPANAVNYSRSLFWQAEIYAKTGRLEKAIKQLEEIIATDEVRANRSENWLSEYRSTLADLYTATGQNQKAEQLYRKMMETNTAKPYTNRVDLAEAKSNLALLQYQNGDRKSGLTGLSNACIDGKKLITEYFPYLTEVQKENFYKPLSQIFETYTSLAIDNSVLQPERLGELYDLQLLTKAILLNSNAKWRKRIKTSGDKKLYALYSTWEMNHSKIAALHEKTDLGSLRQLDSLEQYNKSIEKELVRRSSAFGAMMDKRELSWKDVAKELKDNEVAVEIIRVRAFGVREQLKDTTNGKRQVYNVYGLNDSVKYVGLIVTKSAVNPSIVELPVDIDLESRAIKYYRNSILNKTEDLRSHDIFWKPLGEKIRSLFKGHPNGRIKVYFSADGIFHQINLNTLMNPSTKKYLIDEYQIVDLTSTKDLTESHNYEGENKTAYLFGFPDFGIDEATRQEIFRKESQRNSPLLLAGSQRNSLLSELPGTKTECEVISELLIQNEWTPEMFLENRALEEALKDLFKPRILHVATHGFFEPDSNEGVNPLHRSGLMMAGAGKTLASSSSVIGEDGILTAYEAMNLNLDNTELVVLSACETGLGEIRNGEGVYGLQRAFRVAGARSVIMSLWKVDDLATQDLMITFYTKWLSSGNKRQAFEEAQLQLRSKFPQPYYWGGFVMTGE